MTNRVVEGLEKVGHVIAWPFVHAADLVSTIETGLKDEPEAKTAVVGLIERIETLGADGASALASKGVDLPADLRELYDAKVLFEYVRDVFIPEVKKVYGDIAPEIEKLAGVDSSAPVADPVPAFPGLHTVVAP